MTLTDISFKDPLVQKIIGGLVILILMVAGWYTQLYGPNKELIEEKSKNLEQLNLKLQSARLQAGKLEEIEAELEEAFVKYKLLEKLLPTERDVPDFINKLNMAARQNNVDVNRIELDPSEIMQFYTADPYRIELSGAYHDIGKFLMDVANLPFIATARNIQLEKDSGSKIKANLIITSYHLPSTERLESPTEAAGDSEPPANPQETAMKEAHSG